MQGPAWDGQTNCALACNANGKPHQSFPTGPGDAALGGAVADADQNSANLTARSSRNSHGNAEHPPPIASNVIRVAVHSIELSELQWKFRLMSAFRQFSLWREIVGTPMVKAN
jgi:hypothetical protein